MATKENRTQLIILGCLVLIIIVIGAYKLMGTRTNAAPTEKKEKIEAKSVKNIEVSANTQPEDNMPLVPTTAVYVTRDPFTPQVVARENTSSSGNSQRYIPNPSMDIGLKLPPVTMRPLFTPNLNQNVVPGPTNTEKEMDLKLTGVIEGSVNVAIIRGADNARYIVREGQTIEGKYLVEQVTRFGVRIRFKDRSFILKLGGSNATNSGAQK